MIEARRSKVPYRISVGNLLYEKGAFAEVVSIPKLIAGTMQNMYRTVTNVESYRHTNTLLHYATDMLKHIRGFCLYLSILIQI